MYASHIKHGFGGEGPPCQPITVNPFALNLEYGVVKLKKLLKTCHQWAQKIPPTVTIRGHRRDCRSKPNPTVQRHAAIHTVGFSPLSRGPISTRPERREGRLIPSTLPGCATSTNNGQKGKNSWHRYRYQ